MQNKKKTNLHILNFGINHNYLKSLFLKFGLSIKSYFFHSKELDDKINNFLDLKLDKKDYNLKKKFENSNKKIQNGSLQGYKKVRGLPCKGQRTKTNAKTKKSIV